MKVYRAYKTEIDPNNKQKTLLVKSVGTARFAFNWALGIKKEAFDKKEKIPNAVELNRKLNKLKQTEFTWMYEVSKCSPQIALFDCDDAFKRFFRRCKQKIKGKKGFPKFKHKQIGKGSFSLDGSIKINETYIQLPRLGKLKLKQQGYLPQQSKILGATVSQHVNKWFVSLQVEEEINPPIKQQSIVGIDLGIKMLVTISDGTEFKNPKVLTSNLIKLKRLSKQVSRKIKGSKNRSKARKKLSKFHFHIANIRKDNLHKITSYLTKTKSKIVIEDLNVSGMMKNRKLSRAIIDLGLFEFKRQLEYKGKWYNCEIVIADRFFPSSKKCSSCGKFKENLKLSDREYECDCGLKINRDLNAAINLENYTVSSTEINAFGDGSSGLQAIVNETTIVELGTKQVVNPIVSF